ncbi:MAG: glutamine synthetase family protein [Solirubrobacteraceae bacterium]
MSLTETDPFANNSSTTVRRGGAGGRAALELALARGELREVEILWNDHQGHPRGKRITAEGFLERAHGQGFAFCDAVLCWDVAGDVKDGLRWSSWDTGFPDLFAIPDLDTYRLVPWRKGVGQVICDLYGHDRQLARTAPRTVLRRVLERLAQLGYEAEVGVEIEFHLLTTDGAPLSDGVQAYSLQKASELEPVLDTIVSGLTGYVDLEGSETEYGPGQVEVNLRHARALEAAGQAARLKYGVRELARQAGGLATFMAKPFGDQAGNSMHLHVSLWRKSEPAFAPAGHRENDLHRRAIAGLFEHLPGIILYGAPTVNSYKRFTPLSFAPSTRTWGHDNRTVAIRSLIETPSATRIELRTGAADAEPHWVIAATLAAIIAGLEREPADPGEPGQGNLYGSGEPLPGNLGEGIAAARADAVITEILGEDAVHDYTKLAQYEWESFLSAVTDWDRDRYLTSI